MSLVKDILRPVPGVKKLSRLRQQMDFKGSADFWERRYAEGGTSGPGSYGALARGKADFLNEFVQSRGVQSVIEFGCGDGHQLSLAAYPAYTGLDVSSSAIQMCKRRFGDDPDKSFFLYDGSCFVDRAGVFQADLALSLDVIYHLVEDSIYEAYMTHLFGAGRRYVVVYATNGNIYDGAAHVLHRPFSEWADRNCPQWALTSVTPGPDSGDRRADFYVFERA